MPVLHLFLDQPEELPDDVIRLSSGFTLSAMPGGMADGATSCALRFDLPDGRVVVAETSLALLVAAVRALQVRYPEQDPD